MLMKCIGSLYIFISKVSNRIGASLKVGQGIRLSLLPSPFLPLLSPFILSPFSIPFSSYSLIPPFQFKPLSHPNCLLLFHLLSSLPSASPTVRCPSIVHRDTLSSSSIVNNFKHLLLQTVCPIKAKFYMEPPWVGGTKVCSRRPYMIKTLQKSSSPEPAGQ